jgi:hypothetical protein
MPNPTTNYGWVTPVVGGSNNAWGTILNALFDAVDASVKVVSDAGVAVAASVTALQTVNTSITAAVKCTTGAISAGVLAWTAETYKTRADLHSNAVNPSRISIASIIGGPLALSARVQIESTAALSNSTVTFSLRKNGGTVLVTATATSPGNGSPVSTRLEYEDLCANNDYYEITATINGSGTVVGLSFAANRLQ